MLSEVISRDLFGSPGIPEEDGAALEPQTRSHSLHHSMFMSEISTNSGQILTSTSKAHANPFLVLPQDPPKPRISYQARSPKDNKRSNEHRRGKSSSKRVTTSRTSKTTTNTRARGHNRVLTSQLETVMLSLTKAIGVSTSQMIGTTKMPPRVRTRAIDYIVIKTKQRKTGMQNQTMKIGITTIKMTGTKEMTTITTTTIMTTRSQTGDMRPKEERAAIEVRATATRIMAIEDPGEAVQGTRSTTTAITMVTILVASVTMASSTRSKCIRLRAGYMLSQSRTTQDFIQLQSVQINAKVAGRTKAQIPERIMGINTETVVMAITMGLNARAQEID
jgi:hypothetical protein